MQRHIKICSKKKSRQQFCTPAPSTSTKISTKKPKKNEREKFLSHFDGDVKLLTSMYKKRILVYEIKHKQRDELDVYVALKNLKETIKKIIKFELSIHDVIKFNIKGVMDFLKTEENGTERTEEVYLQTKYTVLNYSENVDNVLDEEFKDLKERFENWVSMGSGWSYQYLKCFFINICKYNALSGSSFVPLPKDIASKKAVINIFNTSDNLCFLYSILCKTERIEHKHHPEKIFHYKKLLKKLDYQGISMPMKICANVLRDFENRNNLSCNIFGLKKRNLKKNGSKKVLHTVYGPIYHTSSRHKINHINLLYIEGENGNYHFCYIKNFSRLVAAQVNNHKGAVFFCDGCLTRWPSIQKLNDHFDHCMQIQIKIPKEPTLYYKHYDKEVRTPFYIAADFECYLKNIDIKNGKSRATHEHIALSFAYQIISTFDHNDEHLKSVRIFRGEKVAEKFLELLRNDATYIYNNYYKNPVKLVITDDREKAFFESEICSICKQDFDPCVEDVSLKKVRDHDHFGDGSYLAAHSKCNLLRKHRNFLSVFIHNLSNYDCSLFLRALAKDTTRRITVIPCSREKYISFSQSFCVDSFDKNEKRKYVQFSLRFLDSYKFLPEKLSTLAEELKTCDLTHTRASFKDDNSFNLMNKKGFFPYEYISSPEILNEKQLPSREKFFDSLSQSTLSVENYQHALDVFSHFKCKDIGQYFDLYLISDVTLLSDILQSFENLFYRQYGLSLPSFYTLASMSWIAMLKNTRIKLDLLTCPNQISFFKRGVRGGISQIMHKKVVANNKFLKDYDPQKPPMSLFYIDANNLYSLALSDFLPHKNYEWMSDCEVEKLMQIDEKTNEMKIFSIPKNSYYGYTLEVDIDIPLELHDKFNELPFLPESKITENQKCKKLILSLENKKEYVIDYRHLQLALREGLILKKISKGIKYVQSNFMKSFIQKNTVLRMNAKSDFEKLLYKYLNNVLFGKSIQSFYRKQVYLCNNWSSSGTCASKLIAKPNFKSISIFDENFCAIEMKQISVIVDVPIPIGFVCLELSKVHMYKFLYQYLKPKFGDDLMITYIDTDAFFCAIKRDDVYEEFKTDLVKYFDTSGYSEQKLRKYNYTSVNKKVVGMFKDETNGNPVSYFCGVAAKNYIFMWEEEKEEGDNLEILKMQCVKSKGVNKEVSKKITAADFEDCLENETIKEFKMRRIRHIDHVLRTYEMTKIGLSPHDSKRVPIPNSESFSTYAYGHYKIDQQ